MPVYALGSLAPELDPQSWIAPNATVIAQVVLKKDASIWWNCNCASPPAPASLT